jgi:hypothetical protein
MRKVQKSRRAEEQKFRSQKFKSPENNINMNSFLLLFCTIALLNFRSSALS